MKNITLKDYQGIALRLVVANLRKAAKRWHDDGDRHAFSLTAATGAGKTVIAAAVFETLFYGNADLDVPPDPGAVVLWFSDEPSLNEQTRARLMQVSDKISGYDMKVVKGGSFNMEKLQPRTVYFVNRDKLKDDGLLSRGHDFEAEAAIKGQPLIDGVDHTFWDTLTNTIEDPNLTLYMVMDEAHRGMKRQTKANQEEKETIVRRLINGHGSVPALPIVWGISATVAHFDEAMKNAEGFSTMPNVIVDSGLVQDSGLLKDVIALDIPAEVGAFDTVLVRRATKKIMESSREWAAYAEEQDAPLVKPLLVLQVPNTPDHDDVGKALNAIYQTWPDLDAGSVAHVFGDHTDQTFGSHTVPYVSPERVQDESWIRVLIAKDAISTGWDCPRAEVLLSFRPAQDPTHITQLMGRLVRTPLARRIPGNDQLNAVTAILPFFDEATVTAVADALMNGGDGKPMPGRRVLINPKDMLPRTNLPESLWEKFESLPSQSVPRFDARPVPRLTRLAHELSADGIVTDAGKKAHAELHKVLNAARQRYPEELAEAITDVHTVEGKTLLVQMGEKKKSFEEFEAEADVAVIEDAYQRARRAFSPDVARSYAEHLAEDSDEDSEDDALQDAHAQIAAMGLVPQIRDYLECEAEKIADAWLDEHRVSIRSLGDDREETYRVLRETSRQPHPADLVRPKNHLVKTGERLPDGTEKPLPTRMGHVLADSEGKYPFQPGSDWETQVLDKEATRPGYLGWYRNPGSRRPDSLGISYEMDGQTRIVRPDFMFFQEMGDGAIAVSIVDPHGDQYGDALPKVKGLARYAEEHGGHYLRIESLAEVNGKMRVLDLKSAATRKAVREAQDGGGVKSLYADHGGNY